MAGGLKFTGYGLLAYSLIIVVIAYMGAYFFLGTTPLTALRFIGGLFYLLILPGYSLCWALFPDDSEVDSVERLGLSLGLSIPLVLVTVLFGDVVFNVPFTPLNIVLEVGAVLVCLVLFGAGHRIYLKKAVRP